jgi:hypothetical protein
LVREGGPFRHGKFVCDHREHMRRFVLLIAACGHAPPLPDAFVFCTDAQPLAPTFTNVQRLFTRSCTRCHDTLVPLDLLPGAAYADLVGVVPPNYSDPVTDESCGGVLVKPGDPAASYIFQKISTTPCAGSQMPASDVGPAPLEPCAQALIHDWIAAGAHND